MAQEGTLILNLGFAKNDAVFGARPRPITIPFDVAGDHAIQQIFTVGTSDMVLDIENVGTPAYIFFHNLDASSDIKLGGDGSTYPNKVRKGGSGYAILEWNGTDTPDIHAIATPGSADLEALILPL